MTDLRSVMIGDVDHYDSPYMNGIAEASRRLGIAHSEISLRRREQEIYDRVCKAEPHLIWTHMLLWPPRGACTREKLIAICRREKRRGAHVMLHDGDVKAPTRHAHDISDFMSIALCNHQHDRSAWKIPQLYWPYAAFPQDELAKPVPEWRCDLAFAGQLPKTSVYAERTKLVRALQEKMRLDFRVFDPVKEANTLKKTPQLAVSAMSILGFGRPGHLGWVDTRVFQYPGAGGILVHDDVRGFLEPDMYMPYETGNVDSVIAAVEKLAGMPGLDKMRLRAMKHTQEHHSWTARVKEVLAIVLGN